MRRWLLIRRSPEDPEEDLAFYQAYGPRETPTHKLVKVCQRRWQVEDCFAEAKGEVGLDQYEVVRRWDAWHRYVTLCLLAHAFLVVTRFFYAGDGEEADGKKGIWAPSPTR
jgi:SRSO17 transposase